MINRPGERPVAYDEMQFGGKDRGRYRFSMKQMRALTGRKRVPGPTIRKIGEEVFELGYVLIDLETFFVVPAQGTFRSYQRMSDSAQSAEIAAVGQDSRASRPTAHARR